MIDSDSDRTKGRAASCDVTLLHYLGVKLPAGSRPSRFVQDDPDKPAGNGDEGFVIYPDETVEDSVLFGHVTEYYRLRGFVVYPAPRDTTAVYQISDGKRTLFHIHIKNKSSAGEGVLIVVQAVGLASQWLR